MQALPRTRVTRIWSISGAVSSQNLRTLERTQRPLGGSQTCGKNVGNVAAFARPPVSQTRGKKVPAADLHDPVETPSRNSGSPARGHKQSGIRLETATPTATSQGLCVTSASSLTARDAEEAARPSAATRTTATGTVRPSNALSQTCTGRRRARQRLYRDRTRSAVRQEPLLSSASERASAELIERMRGARSLQRRRGGGLAMARLVDGPAELEAGLVAAMAPEGAEVTLGGVRNGMVSDRETRAAEDTLAAALCGALKPGAAGSQGRAGPREIVAAGTQMPAGANATISAGMQGSAGGGKDLGVRGSSVACLQQMLNRVPVAGDMVGQAAAPRQSQCGQLGSRKDSKSEGAGVEEGRLQQGLGKPPESAVADAVGSVTNSGSGDWTTGKESARLAEAVAAVDDGGVRVVEVKSALRECEGVPPVLNLTEGSYGSAQSKHTVAGAAAPGQPATVAEDVPGSKGEEMVQNEEPWRAAGMYRRSGRFARRKEQQASQGNMAENEADAVGTPGCGDAGAQGSGSRGREVGELEEPPLLVRAFATLSAMRRVRQPLGLSWHKFMMTPAWIASAQRRGEGWRHRWRQRVCSQLGEDVYGFVEEGAADEEVGELACALLDSMHDEADRSKSMGGAVMDSTHGDSDCSSQVGSLPHRAQGDADTWKSSGGGVLDTTCDDGDVSRPLSGVLLDSKLKDADMRQSAGGLGSLSNDERSTIAMREAEDGTFSVGACGHGPGSLVKQNAQAASSHKPDAAPITPSSQDEASSALAALGKALSGCDNASQMSSSGSAHHSTRQAQPLSTASTAGNQPPQSSSIQPSAASITAQEAGRSDGTSLAARAVSGAESPGRFAGSAGHSEVCWCSEAGRAREGDGGKQGSESFTGFAWHREVSTRRLAEGAKGGGREKEDEGFTLEPATPVSGEVSVRFGSQRAAGQHTRMGAASSTRHSESREAAQGQQQTGKWAAGRGGDWLVQRALGANGGKFGRAGSGHGSWPEEIQSVGGKVGGQARRVRGTGVISMREQKFESKDEPGTLTVGMGDCEENACGREGNCEGAQGGQEEWCRQRMQWLRSVGDRSTSTGSLEHMAKVKSQKLEAWAAAVEGGGTPGL
jgi:hypothetical protein